LEALARGDSFSRRNAQEYQCLTGIREVGLKVLFSVVVFLGTCPLFASGGDFGMLSLLSDSGIDGPPYEAQVELMKSLAAENDGIEYVEYGKSIQRRPLSGLLLTSSSAEPKEMVLITGATHGNEYLNIADQLVPKWVESMPQDLSAFLAQGGSVFVVPVLNPDGYERRWRWNSFFKDLNRDWPSPGNSLERPTQAESRDLAIFVEEFLQLHNAKLSVALDYHCCADGMLLHPLGWKAGVKRPQADQDETERLIALYEQSFPNPGEIGTPPDILYAATGTTLDYWYLEYGAVALTYEGFRGSESSLLPNHLDFWSLVFTELVESEPSDETLPET